MEDVDFLVAADPGTIKRASSKAGLSPEMLRVVEVHSSLVTDEQSHLSRPELRRFALALELLRAGSVARAGEVLQTPGLDPPTWRPLWLLPDDAGPVPTAVALTTTPDGTETFVGLANGWLTALDFATGVRKQWFDGHHRGAVTAVGVGRAFGAATVVSAAWHALTGELLASTRLRAGILALHGDDQGNVVVRCERELIGLAVTVTSGRTTVSRPARMVAFATFGAAGAVGWLNWKNAAPPKPAPADGPTPRHRSSSPPRPAALLPGATRRADNCFCGSKKPYRDCHGTVPRLDTTGQ